MSGSQLPRSNIPSRRLMYPYVMLRIIGVNADPKTLCTPVAEKPGGFHPVWDKKLTFVVNVPQLAFLRFEVRDAVESSVGPDSVVGSRNFNDDPLIAQYTIKTHKRAQRIPRRSALEAEC